MLIYKEMGPTCSPGPNQSPQLLNVSIWSWSWFLYICVNYDEANFLKIHLQVWSHTCKSGNILHLNPSAAKIQLIRIQE